MIEIRTTRQKLEAVASSFMPRILLFRQTRLNNVAHHGHDSEEYFSALAFNYLVTEIDTAIQKKLINTTGAKVKLSLSPVHAVVLYRILIILAIPSEQYWLLQLRQEWVDILHHQLLAASLLQPRRKPSPVGADFEPDDWD